jgi:hypothetical protein
MGLFKNLYNRLHPASPTPQFSTEKSRAEASTALKKTSTDLNEIIQRAPEVHALATELREQRDRNHFAELLEASMKRA